MPKLKILGSKVDPYLWDGLLDRIDSGNSKPSYNYRGFVLIDLSEGTANETSVYPAWSSKA